MSNIEKLIDGILMQAALMTAYYKALVKEGMTENQAMEIVIAFQDQQIKAASIANIMENDTFTTEFDGLF